MSTIDPFPKQPEERIPGVYEGEYAAEEVITWEEHDLVKLTNITGRAASIANLEGDA